MNSPSASGRARSQGRWWQRLFRRSAPEPLDPDRADLVVVASSFDDTEACSAALDRAAGTSPEWSAELDVVLRHHLLVPASQVDDAVSVAAQDGYTPTTTGPPGPAAESAAGSHIAVTDARSLTLQRVQVLDALHCSQERSRMAGLAQRRGGLVLGWDALQPAADRPSELEEGPQ